MTDLNSVEAMTYKDYPYPVHSESEVHLMETQTNHH